MLRPLALFFYFCCSRVPPPRRAVDGRRMRRSALAGSGTTPQTIPLPKCRIIQRNSRCAAGQRELFLTSRPEIQLDDLSVFDCPTADDPAMMSSTLGVLA